MSETIVLWRGVWHIAWKYDRGPVPMGTICGCDVPSNASVIRDVNRLTFSGPICKRCLSVRRSS